MIAPWQFAVVALAAWRTFRLISDDAVLDRPREALIQRLGDAGTGGSLEVFITCAFCAGFWISLGWVAAFWIEPHWTLIVAVPFAVSASVAVVQIVADALTD